MPGHGGILFNIYEECHDRSSQQLHVILNQFFYLK